MVKRVTLVLAMGALLLTLVAGVAVARTFQCDDNECTGTNRDDTISEQEGQNADNIRGLKGDDRLLAQEFSDDNDVIQGDQGNDRIRTDDGDSRDTVDCGAGRRDEAIVDRGDAVNVNCEDVRGSDMKTLDVTNVNPATGNGIAVAP